MARKTTKKAKKKAVKPTVEDVVEVAAADETPDTIVEDFSEGFELSVSEGLNLEFNEDDADLESDASESRDDSEDLEGEADVLEASDEEHIEGEIRAGADEEPENLEMAAEDEQDEKSGADLSGTELDGFESAEIEDVEHLTVEQIRSITESVLFSTDKPLSIAVIKQAFKGTQVKSKDIREALTFLNEEFAGSARGFTLEEVGGGFQLRTKPENMKYLRQSVKARPFRLSGPALEVMSIVAYKQPVTKAQMDEIRGVESGHLLRALMEKHLVTFGERSDLPGKPMFYETTRKFLEIFGLRNLQELPSLSEIDQLIPEGIGEVEDKETLSDLTGQLSQEIGKTYSEAEDELLKITDELTTISTSSDFFEKEKERMREKRDQERAQSLREAMIVGEAVDPKDAKWLERYEKSLLEARAATEEVEFVTEGMAESDSPAIDDAAVESEREIEMPADAEFASSEQAEAAAVETAESAVEEEDERPLDA